MLFYALQYLKLSCIDIVDVSSVKLKLKHAITEDQSTSTGYSHHGSVPAFCLLGMPQISIKLQLDKRIFREVVTVQLYLTLFGIPLKCLICIFELRTIVKEWQGLFEHLVVGRLLVGINLSVQFIQ